MIQKVSLLLRFATPGFVAAIALSFATHSVAQVGVSIYTQWREFAQRAPIQNLVDRYRLAAAQPDHAELIMNAAYRWEGDRQGHYRCPDTTRIARATVDPATDTAIIFICLRTIEIQRQAIRTFRLLSLLDLQSATEKQYRALYQRYLDYLKGVISRDLLVHDPSIIYEILCDLEYFVFVGLHEGDRPELCARPEIVERHLTAFGKVRDSGIFAPPELLSAISSRTGQTKAQVIEYLLIKAPSNDWARVWQYPAMHECGHLAKCHLGPVTGTKCVEQRDATPSPSSAIHDTATATELEADKWAIEALVKMWGSRFDLILEEMTQVSAFFFVADLAGRDVALMSRARSRFAFPLFANAIRRAMTNASLTSTERQFLDQQLATFANPK